MIIVLTNSCLFFIQAELMGVNPGVKNRRFLNEDAVPTIFCFTEDSDMGSQKNCREKGSHVCFRVDGTDGQIKGR